MSEVITWVGMDVHKKDVHVTRLVGASQECEHWVVRNDDRSLKRLARKLERETAGEIRCCYEAGVCGFSVQRKLHSYSDRIVCELIAPSLIPMKSGDRVKTDRRDALKLAELNRANLLTVIQPPTEEQEAVRDVCRAREDVVEDLRRCRHRLQKFLLRQGRIYTPGRTLWSDAHRKWLMGMRFEDTWSQQVFDDYMLAVEQLEQRLDSFNTRLAGIASHKPYEQPVSWLRCFRGIDTVTAVCIVAELYGFERFGSPRELMSYLGLTPSEYSSGDTSRRGGITKAGNSHVRRLLVEAAHHYRHSPRVGTRLRKRREGQPTKVIAIADKAQHRLCLRYRRLKAGGKPANKAVVAVARELVGFVWAAMQRFEPAMVEAAR